MPAVLQAADICLLTLAFEGTSIFMLEGMAHGCVPVVTRVSGTADVIAEGRDGFVRDVGDLPGLADAVGALASGPASPGPDGAQAALKAGNFCYDAYVSWFLGLVDDVWRESPRTWPGNRPFVPGFNSLLRRGVAALPLLRKLHEWCPRLR